MAKLVVWGGNSVCQGGAGDTHWPDGNQMTARYKGCYRTGRPHSVADSRGPSWKSCPSS